MLESLVIKKWCCLKGIRRCGFVGEGGALLEDAQTSPSYLPSAAFQSRFYGSQLTWLPACRHAIRRGNKELNGKQAPIKGFFF